MKLLAWLIFVYQFLSTLGYISYQPQQIHLSLGDNLTEMVVTWSTRDATNNTLVEYGIGGLVLQKEGSAKLFQNPDSPAQYIHTVRLTDLTPGEKYDYHCGSDLGWSELLFFTAPKDDPKWAPQLAVFGDMGNENPQSLPRLQEETQRGLYDAILHVGDFAYDMYMEKGQIGDEFMNQIQNIAGYLPYMTCPGNHEEKYNFSDYKNRFNMPGEYGELFYSFNLGPVHYISISTEVYYFLNYGVKQLFKQYDWLEKDLQEANLAENRKVRPWIVVYGHRPMYCSNNHSVECTEMQTLTRKGIPLLGWFGLEKLFYDNGVDLLIWAHEHSYERTWPLYQFNVYNGSREAPYTNPCGPVHITTGSAGCKEGRSPFIPNAPHWSAFRSTDYGYMRLKAYNRTHLYFEQVSDDKAGEVIDHVWLIKDEHKPYAQMCLNNINKE